MSSIMPFGNLSFPTGTVITPAVVNCYSVLSLPAFKRAIQFKSENVASFERYVYKNGTPLPTPHKLEKLLRRRPNSYQNPYTFWQTLFAHTEARANGFAWIERSASFQPIGLHNMLPEYVCPIRYDHQDGRGIQQYYIYQPTGLMPSPVPAGVLFGNDVIHLRSGLSWDGMTGIDPAFLHEDTFQTALSFARYQTVYIQKGTNIRGTISFPQGVTKEQVEEIKLVLRTFFRGADSEEDVLCVPDGGEYKNTTLSPKESEMSAQDAGLTKKIAQITGVPPEFLFEQSEAKYNNSVEQAGQNIVRFLFRNMIEQYEDELTFKLLTEAEQDAGYSVHMNPHDLLRGSTKEQEDIAVSSVAGGLRTENEGRGLLGLPPIKDAGADKLRRLGDTGAPATPEEKTNTPAPRKKKPKPPTE